MAFVQPCPVGVTPLLVTFWGWGTFVANEIKKNVSNKFVGEGSKKAVCGGSSPTTLPS